MNSRASAPLLALALVGCVVAANVATARLGFVSAGFGLIVSAGTYAAGLALAVRDALDRAGGLRWVLPTLAVGVVLSAALASPALAVASAAAFALSELADLGVWRRIVRRPAPAPVFRMDSSGHGAYGPPRPLPPLPFRRLALAVVGSNLVGAVVDTAVFLPLSGLPVSASAIGGQVLAKAVYVTAAALLVLVAVRASTSRAVTA